MNNIFQRFLFFILLLASATINSQPAETVIAGINKWHEDHPQEKVFIQTNFEKFAAGESIWFKLWCTLDGRPTFLSKIIYVSLADASGKVITKKMYRSDALSSVSGVIDIDREVLTGSYTLSAYSLWMLNFPQFIFRKSIYIYGSDYQKKGIAGKTANYQFDFFPEGGDMIESVVGQLAFKAVNSSGHPVDFKGAIYANDGTKVSDIQSQHDGMGSIELEPKPGKTYSAKITFANGQTKEYKLPAAKSEGIALQVNNNSASRISIMLNRGEKNKDKFNKIFLIGQINGVPVYKADFNLDEGEVATSIPKKNLPGGLMQITAFDASGNPLSERLVFIDNYQVASPDITLQTISTNKRGHNRWIFRADSLVQPSISAVVVNADIEPSTNQKENIASYMLLTSDIKGYIHNPGYYFADKKTETLQNLDLLLMTQGWRRFTWKQVKSEEEIALKYPIETFMNIRGLVSKSDRKEPVKNGYVTLITKTEDSTTILTNARLTDKGEFIVDSLSFRTKAKISYEGTDNNKVKLPVDVTIYPSHIDSLKQTQAIQQVMPDGAAVVTQQFSKHLNEAVDSFFNSKTLTGVTVTAKKLSKVDSLQKQYVSPIYEMSDQSIFIADNRTYLNIWQFLNETVPGFNVNPFQAGGVTYASFSRYDGLSLTDSEQGIKFFINEMTVSIDAIDALNPNDVALVKVYKGGLGFPLGAESGAISVYTKKGADIKSAVYEKTFSSFDKTGFAFTREFYNPNYTAHPDLNKNEKDKRLTLYWNPSLKTQKTGEYAIDFHNDDQASTFKLIIQGIDSKGKLFYKEQIIK